MGFAKTDTKSNFKKADAFLNLIVTTQKGAEKKIGGLSLYLDNTMHAAIIAKLAEDPEYQLKLSYTLHVQEPENPEDFVL